MNRILFTLFLIIFQPVVSLACDPCALNNMFNHEYGHEDSFSIGVQEQYTNLRKGNDKDFYALKEGEVVRDFSTTQVSAMYQFKNGLGVGANLPFIIRTFDEVVDYRRSFDSDAGIGDATLLLSYSHVFANTSEYKLIASVFSGIKLPTGDTGTIHDSLGDSLNKHHPISVPGTSSGRLLTYGSGSYDFPLGFQLGFLYSRVYVPMFFQYNVKTEGSFDYRFANDTTAFIAPGYIVYLADETAVSLHTLVYGEYKGADELRGERQALSSYSNVYVGPNVIVSLDSGYSIDLSVLSRTTSEDNAIVAPDLRVRLGIVKQF